MTTTHLLHASIDETDAEVSSRRQGRLDWPAALILTTRLSRQALKDTEGGTLCFSGFIGGCVPESLDWSCDIDFRCQTAMGNTFMMKRINLAYNNLLC